MATKTRPKPKKRKRKPKPKPKPKVRKKAPARRKKKKPAAAKKVAAPPGVATVGNGAVAATASALLSSAGVPAPLTATVTLSPTISAPMVFAPPPPGPMPAGVHLEPAFAWQNYGQNLQAQVATLYRLDNGPANDPNVGLRAAQWAVRHLASTGGRGSPVGSSWSFSPVAMNPGAMFDVRAMADLLTFTPAQLMNPAEVSTLVQVQAGTRVEQLIAYAESAGMDLKAMGGNCGQTVAGAISTGTHGGFANQPGFPDLCRALYLVGEGGALHWLERASRPVLSVAEAAAYQAAGVQVRRDDALFNHAVVSLGAFGLWYAVVLETTAAYAVKLDRRPVDFDAALDAQTFDRDFSAYGPEPVIDFATVVNPYRMQRLNGAWRGNGPGTAVRTVLQRAPAGTQPPPGGNVTHPINDADLAQLLAIFAAGAPPLVAPLVDQLMGATYGARAAQGPMSVAYPLSLTHAPTLGMELGVPATSARAVFGVILEYLQAQAKVNRPLPGIVAIRQTPRSEATLSLARWAPTTTFEFGCLRVNGTEELLTGLLDTLDAQAMPFSLHLGMLHGRTATGQSWLTRARLEQLYGAAQIASWVQARQITCPAGTVFSSPFTRSLGLTS